MRISFPFGFVCIKSLRVFILYLYTGIFGMHVLKPGTPGTPEYPEHPGLSVRRATKLGHAIN